MIMALQEHCILSVVVVHAVSLAVLPFFAVLAYSGSCPAAVAERPEPLFPHFVKTVLINVPL